MDPVWSNSSLRIPFFNVNEGVDCAVDANGKLHIATTIASTASQNLDSLYSVTGHTSEDYTWNHTPGKRPYLYDFSTDGTSGWTYFTVDSLGSEAPSSVAGEPGFNDNPWDDNAGKITSDSRIQLSRTPDGQYLVYTWAESDSSITNGVKKWNTLPNVKARLLKTGTNQLSLTEINITKPIGGNGIVNPNVSNRAMLHYTSTKSSTATVSGSTTDIIIPVTVCNSNPYSQLTNNVHYFSAAKLTFTNTYVSSSACSTPVGFKENINENSLFELMPNPASNNCYLTVNLLEAKNIEISLVNYLGQVIKKQIESTTIGENKITIDLSTLNKGVYFISLKQGNTLITKKLIVE